MPSEALEDDFTWILRKALKGLKLAPSEVAERAGIPPTDVLALSRGRFCADTARRIAPILHLDADAFAAIPSYSPEPPLPAGLRRLAFPFDDGFVNAWLIRRDDHAILVDAGTDAAYLTQLLGTDIPPHLNTFITHPHGDHIGGLGALQVHPHTLHAPSAASISRAKPLTPGQQLVHGPLRLRVLDLDGHWPGHLGFLIDGLDLPVCAVGDAIFAGSVGGTPDPARHQIELDRIRNGILSLPDETLLLPGHGPPTGIALEREHNPYLAFTERSL